jgi:hypothetical protein
MSNNSCLFRGKEAVLRAYRFNKVATWGIFIGKDPMFSYEGESLEEGEELLGEVIDNLVEHMSMGTYQLRIYRDLTAKGITNRTEYNYSFRFQLLDDEEYGFRNPNRTVAALQKRIEELEGEEEEEDDSFMGKVGSFLKKRPDVENFLMGKIIGWVNQAMTPKQPAPANMAGFTNMDTTQQQPSPGPQGQPPTSAELYDALSPGERAKFDQAAYILLGGDPQVGTHLLKLATLLQTNPGTYDMLTKM